ncbi:MAG: ferrous iron transporter B [Candidatus Latescibacteria bacterium]|nr:ferrous iron transporter B [Candidatus Latescibacterota bacterium]
MKKILLVGNPNVGKSVIFSRLTGIKVIVSNYPGTTVDFTKGYMKLGEEKVELIDVPGAYTLEPTCKAEEVACEMLEQGDIIVNVLDATNLERHLNLTLQLLGKSKPIIIVLNLWDETRHRGIQIDTKKLEAILGVPVITTSAIRGEGLNDLKKRLNDIKTESQSRQLENQLLINPETRWQEIGKIIAQVQTITHRHHKLDERIGELMIHPFWGLVFGVGIMYLSFQVVRFIGEGLINYLLDPFFYKVYAPLLDKLSIILQPESFTHKILIGNLFDNAIDFKQSMGLLSTGIYVEFGMILPYIISFYFMLSILEDVGYLPRLAIIADNVMHKLGLHGYAIIPMFLGMGCNVPGILATRILESKRERFIAITLISIGVPCAALQAMIIGLVGAHGVKYVMIVYLTLFLVWLITGFILNRTVKGFSPDLVIEVPRYRFPSISQLFKKVWYRVYGFLIEAVPYVLLGVLVVNLLYTFRVFNYIAPYTRGVITKIWGLPESTIVPVLIGFIRKDVAVAMLGPLNLTIKQLIIGSTILAIFFPCIATFTIIIKELGVKNMIKASLIMIGASLIVGGVLNIIL